MHQLPSLPYYNTTPCKLELLTKLNFLCWPSAVWNWVLLICYCWIFEVNILTTMKPKIRTFWKFSPQNDLFKINFLKYEASHKKMKHTAEISGIFSFIWAWVYNAFKHFVTANLLWCCWFSLWRWCCWFSKTGSFSCLFWNAVILSRF